MSKTLRQLMKGTPFYPAFKRLGHYPDFLYWKLRGEPLRSPHLVKQRAVIEYARRFGPKILVETGTYYGEMVAATRDLFREIHTVEYDEPLAKAAKDRFAKYPHIHVIHGDSQVVVPELLKSIHEPCLFWLDAGYYGWANSMGDPNRLTCELDAVLNHEIQNHVILMDDARGLNGNNGAPTLAAFIESIQKRFPQRMVEVKHDILRVTPLVSESKAVR